MSWNELVEARLQFLRVFLLAALAFAGLAMIHTAFVAGRVTKLEKQMSAMERKP